MTSPQLMDTLHATCVAFEGQAILLIGSSGSGKSAIALDLISRGAELVSDDQVILEERDGVLVAKPVEQLEGMIEARGIGILSTEAVSSASVSLVVDLDQTELKRLPEKRTKELLGISVDLIYGRDNWLLTAGVMALLKGAQRVK